MIGVSVTLDDEAIRRALGRVQGRARNLAPMLDEIGAAMVLSTQVRFEQQRGPDGKAWRPLAASTLELREARGASTPRILRDGGELYDSITHTVQGGAEASVAWGSNRIYSRIHQLGGPAGRGGKVTIAARPFLGLDDADREEILRITKEHLEAA